MNAAARVLWAFGAFAATAILAVVASYHWTVGQNGKLEDFAKVAALWLTLLPGALTALMSFLVLRAQQSSATELERLKSSLTADIERLKSDLAANMELTKARLSRSGRAYEEMLRAAMQYYYALASLERGEHVAKTCDKAETTMVTASSYAYAFDTDLSEKWHNYWQCARRIKERGATLKSAAERCELWQCEVKVIGECLDRLKDALRVRVDTLPGNISNEVNRAAEPQA